MPSETHEESTDLPDEPPTSIDPYEILNVPTDASQAQIKKAYKKAALKHHPGSVSYPDFPNLGTHHQNR